MLRSSFSDDGSSSTGAAPGHPPTAIATTPPTVTVTVPSTATATPVTVCPRGNPAASAFAAATAAPGSPGGATGIAIPSFAIPYVANITVIRAMVGPSCLAYQSP